MLLRSGYHAAENTVGTPFVVSGDGVALMGNGAKTSKADGFVITPVVAGTSSPL